jgi:outer membrane protein TolC
MNKLFLKSLYLTSIIGLISYGQVTGQTVTLEQVIKDVCTSSDSVKMMKETLEKANWTVREQYSAALPKASGSMTAVRVYPGYMAPSGMKDLMANFMPSSPDPTSPNPLSDILKSSGAPSFVTSFSLTQPIYTFGKIGTGITVAKEYRESAHQNYKRNIQQLQLAGLDSYFRVVLAELNLNLKKRSLARKSDLHEFLDRNFKLGSGSKAQVLSTQADMKSTYPEIIAAEQGVNTARMMLNMVTGRPLTNTLDLDTASLFTFLSDFTLPSKEDALQKAYENRSDLKALDHLAKANLGGAKIFKSMYLPSIGASAKIGTQGGELKEAFDYDSRTWNLGLAMQWDFFDGLANRSKYQGYMCDSRKLQIASQSVRKSIEIEIETCISEYNAADSNLMATRELLGALKEAYDLTSETFKQGSGQITELQLAEERLGLAEFGIINARYRVIRSRAALMVAMGRQIITMEEQ